MGVSGKLGKLDLSDFTRMDCELPVEDLRGIYEEFIHGFLIAREFGGKTPGVWLRERLGLSVADAEWLFPVWGKASLLSTLALLLWCASHTPSDARLAFDTRNVTLTTPDWKIGVVNGVLLSKYGDRPVDPPDFQSVLTGNHGRPSRCDVIAVNNLMRAAQRRVGTPEMFLAMSILYWRIPNPRDLLLYFYPLRGQMGGLASLVSGLKKAMKGEGNPLSFLLRNLVPDVISYPQFQTAFGNPYRGVGKVTSGRFKIWSLTLDQIKDFQQ